MHPVFNSNTRRYSFSVLPLQILLNICHSEVNVSKWKYRPLCKRTELKGGIFMSHLAPCWVLGTCFIGLPPRRMSRAASWLLCRLSSSAFNLVPSAPSGPACPAFKGKSSEWVRVRNELIFFFLNACISKYKSLEKYSFCWKDTGRHCS